MRVEMNNPLVDRIASLKTETGLSIVLGEYKDAIKAQKELAEIAKDNFELVVNTKNGGVKGNIPVFSKYGFRSLVFLLINKFRKKTPEEKMFKEKLTLLKKGILKI